MICNWHRDLQASVKHKSHCKTIFQYYIQAQRHLGFTHTHKSSLKEWLQVPGSAELLGQTQATHTVPRSRVKADDRGAHKRFITSLWLFILKSK